MHYTPIKENEIKKGEEAYFYDEEQQIYDLVEIQGPLQSQDRISIKFKNRDSPLKDQRTYMGRLFKKNEIIHQNEHKTDRKLINSFDEEHIQILQQQHDEQIKILQQKHEEQIKILQNQHDQDQQKINQLQKKNDELMEFVNSFKKLMTISINLN